MYQCDGCGAAIARKALRYQVSIDVRAAYDTLEVSLWDLVRDHRREMEDLVARMNRTDAANLEEQVYKKMVLDLCPDCQRRFVRAPLDFRGKKPADLPPADIDAFLRSLGFGDDEVQ